jgi:hypothetical protein
VIDERKPNLPKRRAEIFVDYGVDGQYRGWITVVIDETDEEWAFGVMTENGEPIAEAIGDVDAPEFVLDLVRNAGIREVEI